jgi:hypothetical protein
MMCAYFIRPFVADPEKNTIWDTTYEEDVNHTGSTQSSQNSCSKIGSVHLESVTPGKTSVGTNITNWSIGEMELTADLLIDKENIPQSLQKRISIVDFAKKLSSNSVVPTFDLPLITSQLSDQNDVREPCGENSTRLFPQTMEFTCQNLGPFIKSNSNLWYLNRDDSAQEIEMNPAEISICEKTEKNRSDKVKSFCHTTTSSLDMEFTRLAPIMPNKELKEDMEFTCQIPQREVSKLCHSNEFTCQVLSEKETVLTSGSDLEFTCQIPTSPPRIYPKEANRSEVENRVGTNMEFLSGKETVLTSGSDMEFTCQVSTSPPKICPTEANHSELVNRVGTDMEVTCQTPMIKTSGVMDDEMEFTCQVPKLEKNSNLNITLSTDDHNEDSNMEMEVDVSRQVSVNGTLSKSVKTVDVEFACQVPTINDVRQDDMEFTCQIPKIEEKSETNDIMFVVEDYNAKDNMEFTCQIPTQNKDLKSDGEDLMEDRVNTDNLCQISANNMSKTDKTIDSLICQVAGIDSIRQTSTLTDLEFTCQIPKPEKNFKCDSVGNRYTDSDMEYTCQVKQKNSRDEEVEKCVSSDTTCQTLSKTAKSVDDLEFTCQIPKPENNAKCDSVGNRYTDSDMEYTCQIKQRNSRDEEVEKCVSSDTTCHTLSKTAKSVDGLEFTCQISKLEKNSKCDSVGTRYTDSDMEYTCQIKQKNSRDEDIEKCVSSDTTCQTLSKTAKSVNDLEFTCQIPTPENNTKCDSVGNRYTDSDMEYTCQIKQRNSRDEVEKCVSSDTTCQTLSKTAKSVDDLQFTCQIPKLEKNSKCDSVGNRYTDSDMEYTCQIKQRNSRNEVEKCVSSDTTCQTLSKTAKSADDLEFTCQIPKPEKNSKCDSVGNRYTDSDMEYTCEIKQRNSRDKEVEKFVSSDTTCQTLSKTAKSADDLEFTCQVPTDSIRQGEPSRSTDMESTCQLPKMKNDLKFPEVGLGSDAGQVKDDLEFGHERQANVKRAIEKSIEDMEVDQSFSFDNEPDEVNCSEGKSLISVELDQASKNTIDVGQNIDNCMEEMISRSDDCKDTLKAIFNGGETSVCKTPNLKTESLKQSKLPVRTRCSWIKTPESFGKKQKLQHGSQSVLFSENTLVVTHDSSAQKTPEPSFHINFNISSGIDDTQHLLHLTYAKTNPSCFIASRLEGNDESLALNLEDTRHVSRPNLTNIDNWDKTIDVTRNSPEVDVPRRLAHINDTYVLKNKMSIQKIQSDDDVEENWTIRDEDCDVEGHDSSLGLMSEEVLNDNLPNTEEGGRGILGELKQELQTPTQEDLSTWAKSLKKWDIKIRRVSEISDLLERVNTQREHITEYLENFKFRPMRLPKQFVIKEKTRKSIDSLRESSDSGTFCVVSTEEKIRKHEEM